MSYLFARFYLGVVVILLLAWGISSYVFRQKDPAADAKVIEQALGGGCRLVRDALAATEPAEYAATLRRLRERFDFPITLVENSVDLNPTTDWGKRLQSGEPVLARDGMRIRIPGTTTVAKLGPLPSFAPPSQTEIGIGYGMVLAFAAIAIAFLLRPVVFQLQSVERTAKAIAEGDLSARIETLGSTASFPLAKAFNQMADRTQTLLGSQRELLQAISHELRTPLARIRFATDLIETAKSDGERRQRLAAVDASTEQLDEIVGELLAYVRLDSAEEIFDHEMIDLSEIIDEVVGFHTPMHTTIEIEFASDGEHIRTYAIRSGIRRAISNLVQNACKYSRSKVRIVCRLSKLEGNQQSICIEVDDDGPGVATEDRNRIFDPFVRLGKIKKPPGSKPGTGLGLALVKRIARQHHGTVTVDASDLGGAAFVMVIPDQRPPH